MNRHGQDSFLADLFCAGDRASTLVQKIRLRNIFRRS